MKPTKTTPENEREEKIKAQCDQIVYGAAKLMIHDTGAAMPVVLDRILTFAAAQAAVNEGSARAAMMFRQLADSIERGAFNELTGEHGRTIQ